MVHKKTGALAAVVSVILLSGGCARYLPATWFSPGESARPEDVTSVQSIRDLIHATSGTRLKAVNSLLEQYLDFRRSGQSLQATGALQQALQIAPDDALVYYCMAVTQWQNGNAGQARQLAQRGSVYARESLLQGRFAELIRQMQTQEHSGNRQPQQSRIHHTVPSSGPDSGQAAAGEQPE